VNTEFEIHNEDCIEHMATMEPSSVDMSIFSPPFPSVYAYTSSERDIGNSEDFKGDAKLHLSFFFKQLVRIIKPGRVVVVHIQQIPRMKRSGEVGLFDFRGLNIRLAERAGFVFEYDWMVRKNPQALKNGTGVLTPRGYVEIDSLTIGSEVIGSNGKPTTVVGVWPHFEKQMYRVTFNDGSFVECDGDHLWTVNKNAIRYASGWGIRTTKSLFEEGSLTPDGTARRVVPIVAPVEMPERMQPLDPYLVGVLLGDGMLGSRGVVGVCAESEIVESLPIPDEHYTTKLKNSERGGGVASFHIRCKQWHRNDVLSGCREIGIAGMRAWEKKVPDEYKYASIEQRLSVLQGLMDTDGTIKKNGSCYFASVSSELANDVKFMTESLGGICRISAEDSPMYRYKGENRIGRKRYVCCVRLPGYCPFRMKRKADKWKPLARSIHRRIVSIEPTTISDCTCITVEAIDGLFVTENCIVTHNSQAIRTRSRELQFAGLEADRAKTRGTLNDYLLKFRAPGDNQTAIRSRDEVSRNDWIKWAEGCWDDIIETDTLNVAEGRGEDDTKHICPLQLEAIRRCVLLFSAPGELVFSPFTGIGSEGFVSLGGMSPKTKKKILEPRRFYGCELKKEYFDAAVKNCERAIENRIREKQSSLSFDLEENEESDAINV
jgi:DNA modification methylase